MPDTHQATASPLQRWREDYRRAEPAGGTFELGLCMAGAVSAGAYTAGVLDVLVEALDALSAEKRQRQVDGRRPLHEVTLSVVGGASAGGICAALAAAFLDTAFPPVRPETDPGLRRGNPFWHAWVEEVDIRRLLQTSDIARNAAKGEKLGSLLDCAVLDEVLDGLLDDRARPGRALPAPRPWLANPLRAVLTLSNLRGVPYTLRFPGDPRDRVRHWMSHHADHVRFTVPLDDVPAGDGPGWAKGDAPKIGETELRRDAPRHSPGREAFKAVALGTASFPAALLPRVLGRDPEEYAFRAALLPSSPLWLDPLDAKAKWAELLRPDWGARAETSYKALCVDGGAMNNEPLDLVRRVLSGQDTMNLRQPTEAQRALVLIDPFVRPDKEGPSADAGLLGSLMPLFNALIQNSRFKPEDLALAADPTIGSRFMIAPSRGEAWPGERSHIAAGPLGGFLGFFSQAYREHDYFLGRRNALTFLRWIFVLPKTNAKVFGKAGQAPLWSDEDCELWGVPGEGAEGLHLPIIPLCGDLKARADSMDPGQGGEPMPDWPRGVFDPEEIRPLVEQRADAVLPILRDALLERMEMKGPKGWLVRQGLNRGTSYVSGRISDIVMRKVEEGVAKIDQH